MEYKVTVILPVYNVEKYLRECIDSVLAQSLQELEIICINDCSQDNSGIILEEYAEKDKRIIVHRNEINQGLSFSRNRGMDMAHGKYICFLDSDDMITENALEELYETAEEQQSDIIFYNLKMQVEGCEISQEELEYCTKGDYSGIMTGREFFYKMQSTGEERVPVWLQFWRRESLKLYNMRFINGILHEDIYFTYMALMEAKRVYFVNKQYYLYRRHLDSITKKKINIKYISSLIETYGYIMSYWQLHREELIDVLTEEYIENIEYKIVRYLVDLNDNFLSIQQKLGMKSFYSHLLRCIIYKRILKYGCALEPVRLLSLLQVSELIVYGAGKVAQRYINALKFCGACVMAIAVSDMAGNPDQLMDIPVYAIENLTQYRESSTILVAVGNKFRDEVVEKIISLGFRNYVLPD